MFVLSSLVAALPRWAVSFSICCALLMAGCGGNDETAPSDTAGGDSTAADSSNNDPPLPVAAASGENQITPRKLHALLKEKNPDYANNAQIAEDNGQIVAVSLQATAVYDISPLEGLPLQSLDLLQTKVDDLSPLKGMPLGVLFAEKTDVSDVAVLAGMPLKTLWLNQTGVADISPLKDMPIEQLNLCDTPVKDLSVLATLPLNTVWLRDVPATDFSALDGMYLESLDVQGTGFSDEDLKLIKSMPMQRLNIAGTQVTDLTPLKSLRLTRLIFTPSRIKQGLEIVRSMDSLEQLDVTFVDPNSTLKPAAFWARYAAGDFDAPPE